MSLESIALDFAVKIYNNGEVGDSIYEYPDILTMDDDQLDALSMRDKIYTYFIYNVYEMEGFNKVKGVNGYDPYHFSMGISNPAGTFELVTDIFLDTCMEMMANPSQKLVILMVIYMLPTIGYFSDLRIYDDNKYESIRLIRIASCIDGGIRSKWFMSLMIQEYGDEIIDKALKIRNTFNERGIHGDKFNTLPRKFDPHNAQYVYKCYVNNMPILDDSTKFWASPYEAFHEFYKYDNLHIVKFKLNNRDRNIAPDSLKYRFITNVINPILIYDKILPIGLYRKELKSYFTNESFDYNSYDENYGIYHVNDLLISIMRDNLFDKTRKSPYDTLIQFK